MQNRTMIIAEAGVNHNGDLGMAFELVEAAAAAGADYVKFQTFNADRQVTKFAKKATYQEYSTDAAESQYEMLRRLELSDSMHHQLIKRCKQIGIQFLSTGFDIDSATFLKNLGQKLFKIPSGEITNLPYLRHIGAFKKQVILSTGMANMGEIESAIEALEIAGTSRSQLIVLHCTTEYPAPMDEVNLQAMQSIRDTFKVRVGYSDHTRGIEIPIAAVAMGACVIEKHFTLGRNLRGPDHAASIEPDELLSMVVAIRNVELAMGDGIKCITSSERHNKSIVRKSIVASRSIKMGEFFSGENLTIKRPGTGLSPMLWDEVINKKVARRDFQIDELIEL